MARINDTRRLRDLDRSFLERYDLVGPRYTSYPTAPEWREEVGSARVREHLEAERARGSHRPLSIYMHLPFCIEHCTFCACNVIVSTKMEAVSDPYLTLLDREADLYAAHIDTSRPVTQFHWGGGTPTYLSCDQLRRAHGFVASRFNLASEAEQSIEIHVSWTSDEQMRVLAGLGFNRISMGVQDFDPKIQEAIGRRQTYERTAEIIRLAHELGFKGINCDLVYGLPYQTAESFGATVDRILDLRPDRLAVYNFAFLPGRLAHQRPIDPATLPAGEEKFRIFLEAHDRFVAAGYRYIGMDHFALPEDELTQAFDQGTMQRNFMGFTTQAGTDLLGLGVSAISSVTNLFAQNVKKLPAYERAIREGQFPTERGLLLDAGDRLRRDVIQGLMCRDRVDKRAIEAAHGIVFDEYFAPELERLAPLVADELLDVRGDALSLNFLGRLFVRNIAMVFDAYLNRAGSQHQFSRTL
jgi:oxygen-independent coproporphyrinogen-3 oxidase